MKVFVTGATGYIGHSLVKELVSSGYKVAALVRSKEKAVDLAQIGVQLHVGDLQDTQLIEQAMIGADAVFHLAAYAKLWPDDEHLYKQVNVAGTNTVLAAALRNKVKRVVFTSTASVYGPSASAGSLVNEATRRCMPFTNSYESSKAEAEKLAIAYAEKGLHIVIVQPTRVYGPGLETDSNGISKLLRLYLAGKWRFIPGDGNSIGNYSFIDDVVRGHILAMEQGRSGESYLLGGEDASYNDLFELFRQVSGVQRALVRVPAWLLLFISRGLTLVAKLTGRKPLITPEWAKKFLLNWSVSSQKAVKELGYTVTPLQEGLYKTLQSL